MPACGTALTLAQIRGPSGGGKTSLLNMIGTIDTPTEGDLLLFGAKVDTTAGDGALASLRLSKIGFVFQTFNLLGTLSAFENVELPMTILGKLSAKDRKARAKHLLSLVGLQDRMTHLPSELSGTMALLVQMQLQLQPIHPLSDCSGPCQVVSNNE